jgi:hypothetical protein
MLQPLANLEDSSANEPRQVTEAAAPPLPQWAQRLAWLLDDVVQSPGGRFGVGADGVIGLLVPGAGDAITGLGSAALLVLALREGVPTVMIGRMLMNILIDLVIGFIPIAGDVFDFAWRANRRNYEIIEKYRDPNAEPTVIDHVLVVGGLVLALLIMATPFIMWFFYAAVIAFFASLLYTGQW